MDVTNGFSTSVQILTLGTHHQEVVLQSVFVNKSQLFLHAAKEMA